MMGKKQTVVGFVSLSVGGETSSNLRLSSQQKAMCGEMHPSTKKL